MTISVTEHIKNHTGYHLLYIFQLLIRDFDMLTPVPLKETHGVCRKDDLVQIILIYV
jgi:hypothetical protein